MKTGQTKSYYIRDIDTNEFLNDKKQLTFGEHPVKLTYTNAKRLCKLINLKYNYKKRIDLFLIKQSSNH